MRSPCVRLILKGQTLAEIPFEGDALRIGRMKENDVVIHNLAVSRFHATLTREGDTFVIQDSGSENGIYVNGEQQSRAVVGPGDQILIGKHQLQICLEGAEASADGSGGAGASDAWDASNTYFVGVDTQAKMLQGAQMEPDADTDGELIETEPLQENPEPETVLIGDPLEDEELPTSKALTAELDEEPDTVLVDSQDPESVELFGALAEGEASPDPTSEYDVGMADIEAARAADLPDAELLVTPEPEEPVRGDLEDAIAAPAPLEEADPAPSQGPYAGLIISRRGRFERVLRWDAERLCLGRAVECDVVLSAAEVSRNHTLLVRDGDTYEVRDLESINGTWVNGEKISRRELEVGDVIRIDEFELTFVLENGPIGDEIVAQAPEEIHAVPSGEAKAFTQLGEMLDLAPFDVGDGAPLAAEAGAMSFDDPSPGEPATVVIDDDTTDRSDQPAAGAAVSLEEKPESGGVLALELTIRLEELPEPLREALRTLDDSELRLPVELSLKTRDA